MAVVARWDECSENFYCVMRCDTGTRHTAEECCGCVWMLVELWRYITKLPLQSAGSQGREGDCCLRVIVKWEFAVETMRQRIKAVGSGVEGPIAAVAVHGVFRWPRKCCLWWMLSRTLFNRITYLHSIQMQICLRHPSIQILRAFLIENLAIHLNRTSHRM